MDSIQNRVGRLAGEFVMLRRQMPFHSAFNVWVVDCVFRDPKWWDPADGGYRRWREWVLDRAAEVSGFVQERWPWCSHLIVDDQCGISEHRYCVHCQRSFPNAEVSNAG